MKHFNKTYKATTINLLCSSLAAVVSLGIGNWSAAIWATNAWVWTYMLRQLIRGLNDETKPTDDKVTNE